MATEILVYRKGTDSVTEGTVADLQTLLSDPELTVWIDLSGHGPAEEKLLMEVFKFHPLVIEDVFADAEVPKIEDFGEYLYVIVHGVRHNPENILDVDTVELDIFLAERFVVTHHNHDMRSVVAVKNELRRQPRMMQKGAAFVAHGILDHLTDHYLPVVDKMDEEIESLESELIENPGPSSLERIFRLKRAVQKLRRTSLHQKDILQRLSRGEFELVPENALPYFRDVYDHFVRVGDLADSYRDLVTTLLDAYFTFQSQRMNEIMKMLTVISTIMLPLTFIAGVYGMNFKFMPELNWKFGYLFAWSLMVCVAGTLLWFFKRRGWL